MRVAIFSDLHANLAALEAVRKDAADRHIDETWCLGDVVGYGGNPRECLEWAVGTDLVIKGNHDEAVATGDVSWFNPLAAQAARMHAQMLTPPERSRLYGWPTETRRTVAGLEVLLVHGSPDDPLHEYVQPPDARRGVRRWEGLADVILMGHTHRPYAVELVGSTKSAWTLEGFQDTERADEAGAAPILLVNPGSVGQPRDGDPRASYAILDFATRTVELHRVPYDVESAARAIRRAGLDMALAMRLYDGR